MARQIDPEEAARAAEKKKLKEERKKLKQDRKNQQKEAKKKVKELNSRQAELTEDEDPAGIPVFLVTVIIIAIWLAILAVLVKLDVGGIGSGVLAPIFRNVPVIQKILPDENGTEETDDGSYGGYANMKEAVDHIKELEQELQIAQENALALNEQNTQLQQETARLQQFEDNQAEFDRIREEFYTEVVYSEKGPGAEEYLKYYESMNPEMAEIIYKQVVQERAVSKEVEAYASAYAAMKPKDAAAIFDTMTDDFELVAKILDAMGADDRGKILAQMKEENAARITKIMEPVQE